MNQFLKRLSQALLALCFMLIIFIISLNQNTTTTLNTEYIDLTPSTEQSTPAIPTGPDDGLRDEESIYSFLQGPVAWQNKYPWSGYWGELITEEGGSFGGFGCGLCCIANIYDTLSPYEASPVDTYEYAKEVSSYCPTAGSGAIGWEAMLKTLKTLGMDAELKKKPKTFNKFKEAMSDSEMAIILIQCDDPDAIWGDTPGHYVNIWRFNPDDNTVFVKNSGEYEKNRKTVKLKECYDYLKEISAYQILYVHSYNEEKDEWKRAEKASGKWNRPDYCKEKF